MFRCLQSSKLQQRHTDCPGSSLLLGLFVEDPDSLSSHQVHPTKILVLVRCKKSKQGVVPNTWSFSSGIASTRWQRAFHSYHLFFSFLPRSLADCRYAGCSLFSKSFLPWNFVRMRRHWVPGGLYPFDKSFGLALQIEEHQCPAWQNHVPPRCACGNMYAQRLPLGPVAIDLGPFRRQLCCNSVER